jgi:hypothetical protein
MTSVNLHEDYLKKGTDLGFNGPIVSIKSNFLPPQPDYTSHWLGAVKVYALQKEVDIKHFKCEDEHQLKMQVAAYVESIIDKVSAA